MHFVIFNGQPLNKWFYYRLGFGQDGGDFVSDAIGINSFAGKSLFKECDWKSFICIGSS